MVKQWWHLTIEEAARALGANSSLGLASDEARARLQKYGPNQLKEKKPISPLSIFLSQFQDFIVWILIAAALVSGFLKKWVDAFAIIAIVILNAILGFVQEYRAEKSLAALKKLSSPASKVIRDGQHNVISSHELVPGDLITLEAGDNVPADSRMVWRTANFSTQEASLTGESTPVAKTDVSLEEKETPLAERSNMVYMGTSVAAGKARALVCETGMRTELGKIAGMIQDVQEETTPLQKKLEEFGKWIVYLCFILVGLVFLLEWLRGGKLIEVFLTAVSLAVAAIPEGLPAVVTIALALGVQRMVKRHTLIRKLPSVETLGCTTVICSDKTGTLTKNEMTVQAVSADSALFKVTGAGYHAQGTFSDQPEGIGLLLQAGVLCNDARFDGNNVIGDPTEAALLISAKKRRIEQEEENLRSPRINELLFDSQRKRMSTVHKEKKRIRQYTKGAVDMMLPCCTHILIDGEPAKMSISQKKKILEMNHHFASQALRVLGFAYKDIKEKDGPSEDALCFIGMQA